jgi:hypothetical protein
MEGCSHEEERLEMSDAVMPRTYTQKDIDELIEKRLNKVRQQRWRQLETAVCENATLRDELDRIRNRSFIERLIDLFRPSRSSRPVNVNTPCGDLEHDTRRTHRSAFDR